jgi:hypothetical protein
MDFKSDVDLSFFRDTLLEKQRKEETIKKAVIEKLTNDVVADLSTHRRKPIMVQLLCSLVEKYSKPGNSKEKHPVDKKNIVLEIYMTLYQGTNADELQAVSDLLNHFHQANQIKRLTKIGRFFTLAALDRKNILKIAAQQLTLSALQHLVLRYVLVDIELPAYILFLILIL